MIVIFFNKFDQNLNNLTSEEMRFIFFFETEGVLQSSALQHGQEDDHTVV